MRIASSPTWLVLLFVVLGASPAAAADCPSELGVPGVSPAGGLFHVSPVTVTMTGASADPNIIIMFSTDGGPPVPFYSQPLQLTKTTTVKAQLRCRQPWGEFVYGGIVTYDFILQVGAPVFSIPGGTYQPGTAIDVSTVTPGALLRYRVDGQTPTATDPIVPPDGRLMVGAFALTVRGFYGEMDPSVVSTGTYAPTWHYSNGSVSTGIDFSVALKPDGTVWTWGGNSVRQLGHGETAAGTLSLLQQWTPVPLGITGVRAIAAASQAVFALREDGTVLTWGAQPASGAGYGLLGRATCTLPYSTPGRCVRAEGIGLTNIRGIAAGSLHGLAVDADGYVWAWGYNNQGQLGDNTTTSRWQPQIVPGLSGVVEVAAGGHVSYARK